MSNVIVCGADESAGADRTAVMASALAERLGRELTLVDVEAVAAGGEPAGELARMAGELDAELLVVGSRGRHELGSAVLGSVAAELIRDAPCPVVLVPPEAALPFEQERRALVCGVEGSDRDRDILRLADDLRRRLSGTLHAVHAFDPTPVAAGAGGPPLVPELEDTAHIRLARALRESGVDADATVVSLPPALALQRMADNQSAALIVVGCRGRGKVASVLLGSVSIQLGADATCPVVVLPPQAELSPGSGNYELAAGAA